MSEEQKPQDNDQVLAAGQKLMVMMGMFHQIGAALGAYRTTLTGGGIGADTADQMTAELQTWILTRLTNSLTSGKAAPGIKDALEAAIRDSAHTRRGK